MEQIGRAFFACGRLGTSGSKRLCNHLARAITTTEVAAITNGPRTAVKLTIRRRVGCFTPAGNSLVRPDLGDISGFVGHQLLLPLGCQYISLPFSEIASPLSAKISSEVWGLARMNSRGLVRRTNIDSVWKCASNGRCMTASTTAAGTLSSNG